MTKRFLSLTLILIAGGIAGLNPAIAEENYTELKDKLPIRETRYLIRVPKDWNGTLINDLDYYTNPDSPRNRQLLDHGYALSGTGRRSDRFESYDPAHEIHDFITILDLFESKFGKPKRTIQLGCSGGGTVTLAMAEIHPDRIDGAIAACASTSPWMANTHLDGLFVLKSLLAPELPIVDLHSLDAEQLEKLGNSWKEAITKAQQSAAGRARIALAITIGQWPAWGGSGKAPVEKPDPTDVAALQESMYQCLLRLVPSKKTWGTTMLELAGRGQLRSNNGIDYAELFNNGNLANKNAVESLYKEAGLELTTDLKTINAAPRIVAAPSAIKWWSAPGRTHIGEPKVPLLRIHTIGDGLVYPAMAQGYEELVKDNGHAIFLRTAYVDRWGHCSFSTAEWLAAIDTLVQRLDTGTWPSTEPAALNQRAKALLTKNESAARFCEFKSVEKYNRTWVPGTENFRGLDKPE